MSQFLSSEVEAEMLCVTSRLEQKISVSHFLTLFPCSSDLRRTLIQVVPVPHGITFVNLGP